MPIDFDASPDAAAAPHAQPQRIFDGPLRRAAQQLIDLGGVSEVRVLQNGRVVTGIAAEETYRTVHRWIDARRANRSADELALRKTLQADHPVLFRYLKRSVQG